MPFAIDGLKTFFMQFELSKLELFLVGVFALIFAGFFFLPTSPHRLIMYVGVPFMIFYLYRQRIWQVLRDAPQLLYLVLLFACFYGVSAFWSVGVDVDRIFNKAKLLLFIPLVFLSLFLLVRQSSQIWQILCASLLLSAIVSSIALLLVNFDTYFVKHLFTVRLEGFGRAENSVQCGLLYGLACFLFLFPSKESVSFFKKPYVRAVGVVLCLSMMLLAGSRGPLVALVGCLIVTFALRGNLKRSFFIGLACLAIMGGYILSPIDPGGFKSRGDSARLLVWKEVVAEIKEKPFFGHGVAQENDRSIYYEPMKKYVPVTHAHSIYLSALAHVGFLGFGLFVALISYAGLYGVRIARDHQEFSAIGFAVFGLILGIFDFGGYFTNLGTAWIVFWFPLAAICAYAYRNQFQADVKA